MSSPESPLIVTNFIEALKAQVKILKSSPALGLLKVNSEMNTVDDIFGLAKSFSDIQSFLISGYAKDKNYLNTIKGNITMYLGVIQEKSLTIESEFRKQAFNASKTKSDIINAQESYVFNYGALVYMTKILTNLMNVVKFVEVSKSVPSVNVSSQTNATRTTNTGTNAAQALTRTNTGKAELTVKVMILRLQKDKLLAELRAKKEALEKLETSQIASLKLQIESLKSQIASLTSQINNIKEHASRIITNLNDHIHDQQLKLSNAKANVNAANKAVVIIKNELLALDNEYAEFCAKVQEQLDEDLKAIQGIVDQYSSAQPQPQNATGTPERKDQLLAEINSILAFLQQENIRLNANINAQANNADDFALQQIAHVEEEMKFKDAYYAMRDIAASSLEFNFE